MILLFFLSYWFLGIINLPKNGWWRPLVLESDLVFYLPLLSSSLFFRNFAHKMIWMRFYPSCLIFGIYALPWFWIPLWFSLSFIKPVDNSWNEALHNKLSIHLFLLYFCQRSFFYIYTSLLLVLYALIGAFLFENANLWIKSYDYKGLAFNQSLRRFLQLEPRLISYVMVGYNN